MKKNYIEEEFKSKTLFKDVSVFDSEYVPDKLLHRENELVLLSKIFLPVIKSPNSLSRKVLITGNVGVGKTVTLHYFAYMLSESAQKRNLKIKICHLNCRTNKSSYLILKSILTKLSQHVPSRGLSPTELLDILVNYLTSNKLHLILILDELGFLKKKHSDILYTLSRISEIYQSKLSYISIIGVIKNLLALRHLDNSILSTLQNQIIKFKKYTQNQIFDILKERVENGLKDEAISDDLINMIASFASKNGDMRKALRILKNSVLYSEKNYLKEVNTESIRIANSEFCPVNDKELEDLNLHEIILFRSICSLLGFKDRQNVTLMEIKVEYESLCNEFCEKPRSYTQIWEYVQNLEKMDLIEIEIKNREIKGRKSLISTPVPAKIMGKKLDNLIIEHNMGAYSE